MKTLINFAVILFFAIAFNGIAYSNDECSFNGIDDVLYFQENSISNLREITVEVCVKVNSFSACKSGANEIWQFIVFKKNKLDHFNEGFAIYLDEKNERFATSVASAKGIQAVIVDKKHSVELGRWYRLRMSANSKEIKFFVDGVLVKSAPTGFPLDFDSEELFIGGRTKILKDKDFEGRFCGSIKNIKIWSKVLDEDDLENENSCEKNIVISADITRSNGLLCLKNSSFEVQDLEAQNIEAIEDVSDFSAQILPNPVQNEAKLNLNLKRSGNLCVKVFDIAGKEHLTLFEGYAEKGDFSFNISNLLVQVTNSYYFCKIDFEASSKIIKFIVTK